MRSTAVSEKARKARARWAAMGVRYTPLNQIAAPKKMDRGKVAAKDRVVMADWLQLDPRY